MVSLRLTSLSHGSSFKYLIQVSNVAPPHTSKEKNPTLSISSAIGNISRVLILVAKRDWCASRNVVSIIFILPIAIPRWIRIHFSGMCLSTLILKLIISLTNSYKCRGLFRKILNKTVEFRGIFGFYKKTIFPKEINIFSFLKIKGLWRLKIKFKDLELKK